MGKTKKDHGKARILAVNTGNGNAEKHKKTYKIAHRK